MVIARKENLHPKEVLIQVPKGTPKTEAILKPEKIHEISQTRFWTGATRLPKVSANEIRTPETSAVKILEKTSIEYPTATALKILLRIKIRKNKIKDLK